MSAIDGYAIHIDDLAQPLSCWHLGRSIAAGNPEERQMEAGTALPISTGARIPANCASVIPRERAILDQGQLRLSSPPRPGDNIRRMGEDAFASQLVLRPGIMISPAAIGALASFGVENVSVFRRPKVALLVTGDEVGRQICDANGPMIAAALCQRGISLVHRQLASDDVTELRSHMKAAIAAVDSDLFISTGGISVGERDFIRPLLDELGATVHFHGVAMRPGKPVLFATLSDGRQFFALPGNPVAAIVCFRFFVATALSAMQGLEIEEGRCIPETVPGKDGLTVFLKATQLPDGFPRPLPGQESHKMLPLIDADCWMSVRNMNGEIQARVHPMDACF